MGSLEDSYRPNTGNELVDTQLELLEACGDMVVTSLNGPSTSVGRQSLDNELRVRHASELSIRGALPLHFVGGSAAVNRQYALDEFPALKHQQVTCDDWSHDTIGNAISVREYIDDNQLDGTGVVTLGYHMPRALFCFRAVLGATQSVVPCRPAETAYSPIVEAKLRASQTAIGVYNRWQLRGFDAGSDGALQILKTSLEQGHRYGGEKRSVGRAVMRRLDKFTTGKS